MIIRKLKETLGQVFHSPEAMGSWQVECAIDDNLVDCQDFQEEYDEGDAFIEDALNYYEPYVGVPAPAYLEDDPWFGPAPTLTEKQEEHRQIEATQRLHDDIRKEQETKEPENIHELMYQKATSNWNTVSETQQTQGGSENFHEGPGGWMSGNGMGQFNK